MSAEHFLKPAHVKRALGDMLRRLEPLTVEEIELEARRRLHPRTYALLAGGAGRETTSENNRRALQEIPLQTRNLVDVSGRSQETTLLGSWIDAPIVIGMQSGQNLLHGDGELATARAAAGAGVMGAMVLQAGSTMAEFREAYGGSPWLTFGHNSREITEYIVARAEELGFAALCHTVDYPIDTRSDRRQARRGLPMKQAYLSWRRPGWATLHRERPDLYERVRASFSLSPPPRSSLELVPEAFRRLSWRDLKWLRGTTRLPLILKGITCVDDALRARDEGADAIVVSNHGGRLSDSMPSPAQALPSIRRALGPDYTILFDSGIRSGLDIFKALALGASAVCIGRPVLYGLAWQGETGIRKVLNIMRLELDQAMAVCGVRNISEITSDTIG